MASDLLLILVVTIGHLIEISLSCDSSIDCSLNGDCVGQVCVCDNGWKGPQCDVLGLVPGSSKYGYHNSSEASWGGNAVYEDGQWHLFVAQFANSCPLAYWGTNSEIIRATSDSPAGPFTYEETIIGTFAHNPTIQLGYDGYYYLFMIGDGQEPTAYNCTNATSGNVSVDINQINYQDNTYNISESPYYTSSIYVSRAASVKGPWSVPNVLNFTNDASRSFCGGTNPSPHFEPDGSVYLAFNAEPCEGYPGEFIWFARADQWNQPFTLVSPEPVTPRNATLHPVCVAGTDEDPFLWRSSRGFHILTHGMCPSGLRQAHLKYSADGLNWFASPRQTYHYSVEYSDISPHVFARVERPQLIFDKKNLTTGYNSDPIFLFNGVCGTGQDGSDFECVFDQLTGMTWTLVRPISPITSTEC